MTDRSRSIVPAFHGARLAGEPPRSASIAPAKAETTLEVLAFALADEQFAMRLGTVREILLVPDITEVPRAPRDVLGVVSVRGRITTVIDLRRRMRLAEPDLTRHARILLIEHRTEIIGLLVDRVIQVFRLRQDEIEHASSAAPDSSDYVIGIGRPKGQKQGGKEDLYVLLDPVPLLDR